MKSTYIYNVGDSDKKRLALLNEIYNPNTKNTLLNLGIKTKKCIVDLGCGHGQLSCWMASQAPEALIIGIDSSPKQIEIARKQAENMGLENIRFIIKRIEDIDPINPKLQLGISPDLIYCRWLLMHIPFKNAIDLLKTMLELLDEDGIAVYEEATMAPNITPQTQKYDGFMSYMHIFTVLADKMNVDFNIGATLETYLAQTGYKNVSYIVSNPTFTKSQMEYFKLDIQSVEHLLKQYDIATDIMIEKLYDTLEAERLSYNDDIALANYIWVSSKRR